MRNNSISNNNANDDDSFACRIIKQMNHHRLPVPVESYIDLEDSEEEEEEGDMNMEMGCPYCSEDGFDALGLCVHLEDQHPLEIKLGVCPLCATNQGRNMISHLIIQHESILRGLCKRKFHDDESLSIISLLRRKLQEQSRSLQKESASVTSSPSSSTDPLLLSFVYNPSQSHKPEVDSFAELSSSKILKDNLESGSGSDIPAASRVHNQKAKTSDFVQAILLSTIFADTL